MSSRTLAAAKARRAGEKAPPVSGNRPVTSIGSQAAFAQQLPPNMGYNMPPPPNNVRIARAAVPQPPPEQYQQFYKQSPQQQPHMQPNQQPQSENSLPFSKLSISDAIGLITLRLGRVEQWIIETDNENENKETSTSSIPDNHKLIDNAMFATIINRLDALEKNKGNSEVSQNDKEEFKQLKEQVTRIADEVNKHTIEVAKNTEQVFKFNRELVETKDILKSFMLKYDMFTQEINQMFSDYEMALSEIEQKLPGHESAELNNENNTIENENDKIQNEKEKIETKPIDLKNMIKQELSTNID